MHFSGYGRGIRITGHIPYADGVTTTVSPWPTLLLAQPPHTDLSATDRSTQKRVYHRRSSQVDTEADHIPDTGGVIVWSG